jgi:hypothetical protein
LNFRILSVSSTRNCSAWLGADVGRYFTFV